MTPDELPTSDRNKPGSAEPEREEAAKRISMMEMIRNLFRNLFGSKKDPQAEAEAKKKEAQASGQKAIVGQWDELTDDSNALKQRFDNTLADLQQGEPQQPLGSQATDPAAMEAYRQSLQAHHKKIEGAEKSYTHDLTELQQRRDQLLASAGAIGVTGMDSTVLDAQLGTEGDGPGHKWFQALKNETEFALEELDAKPQELAAIPEEIAIAPSISGQQNEGDGIIRTQQDRKDVVNAVKDLLNDAKSRGKETGDFSLDLEKIHQETAKLSAPSDLDNLSAKDQLQVGVNLEAKSAIYDALRDYEPDDPRGIQDFVQYAGSEGFTKSPDSSDYNRQTEKGLLKDFGGFKEEIDRTEQHVSKNMAALATKYPDPSETSSTPTMTM